MRELQVWKKQVSEKKEPNHNEPHRDARLSCALVSAVANTLTWPKPSNPPTTHPPPNTHTFTTPLKYICPSHRALGGDICGERLVWKQCTFQFALPSLCWDKQDCGPFPGDWCVCVCVWPLKVFHNNQRWNQKWNETQRHAEREKPRFYQLNCTQTLMFHSWKPEEHV